MGNAIGKAHNNADKFVLTVERMAWDDAGKAATRALLNDPAARSSLVSDIVDEIASRGVDGVSLDFEPILSDERDNFAAFAAELRAAMYVADPAYQITFATTGFQSAQALSMIDSLTSSGAADAAVIMAYPLRGLDAQYAGGLAPMRSSTVYDLVDIANSYLTTMAADKIVMALPWYGREWPTVTADLHSAVRTDPALYGRPHNIDYDDALVYARQYGRSLDAREMSAWTEFPSRACATCPETWKQVYYDDVDTYAYKFDWIVSKGFAGIGIFALGYDGTQPELWKLLRVKYRGLVDAVAPAGTVTFASGENLCSAPVVSLALQGSDSGGSGLAYVRLSNASDTAADGSLVAGRTYPPTTSLSWSISDPGLGGTAATGPHAIYAQWRDVAGNWSSPVRLDYDYDPATATISVDGGAQFVNTALVPVVVTQTGGRSILSVRVSSDPTLTGATLASGVDGVLGTAISLTLGDPTTEGKHLIYAQWQDAAGCWSTPVAAEVVLDVTPPSGSLKVADGLTVSADGSVELLAPAIDAGSGVSALEISNDRVAWQAFAPTGEAITWTAGSRPDGPWTITARWTDAAGNTSTASTSLVLDRNGPDGTIMIDGGAPWTDIRTVSVGVPATDAASSVVEVLLADDPSLTAEGVLAGGVAFPAGGPIEWTLPDADGEHVVYAQWRDSVGHWSSVQAAAIGLDQTAPEIVSNLLGLSAGTHLNDGEVPVSATVAATDAGSGVIQDGVAITRWPDADVVAYSPTAGTSTLIVDTSSGWSVHAEAIDAAGNVANTTTPFTVGLIEDGSPAVRYGTGWRTATNASASGGTTHYASAYGASARFHFTGRSVAWVAPTSATRGRARIYIDGVSAGRVDLGRVGTDARRLVFAKTWQTVGAHTIRVMVLGTAGRPRVDVDGFVVIG